MIIQYNANTPRQNLLIYLDCIQLISQINGPINLDKPIAYIGNSKSGNKPFGMMADFRFYPYLYEFEPRNKNVDETSFKQNYLSKGEDYSWHKKVEVNDMSPYIYQKRHIIRKLVENIEIHSEIPLTLTEITRTLGN